MRGNSFREIFTPTEYPNRSFLWALLVNPSKVLTHCYLLCEIWAPTFIRE